VPGKESSRPATARGRQNSAQSLAQDGVRLRPQSSASNLQDLSHGSTVGQEGATTSSSGKGLSDTRKAGKTSLNGGDEVRREDDTLEGRGVPSGTSKLEDDEKQLKREDTESSIQHQTVVTTTRAAKTKTASPAVAAFQDSHRSRPSRGEANANPLSSKNRSHKKGAGLAALKQAHAADVEEDSSIQSIDDEDDANDDEPRYCYCNRVSFGEMVACDNEKCVKEWFHLDCAGLKKAPGKNGKCLSVLDGIDSLMFWSDG
jgi:hypothetical protein